MAQLTKDLEARPPVVSTVDVYTDANVIEVKTDKGDFYTVEYPQSQERKLIGSSDQGASSVADSVASTSIVGKADVDTTITTDGARGDAIAEDLDTNSSAVKRRRLPPAARDPAHPLRAHHDRAQRLPDGAHHEQHPHAGIAFAVLAVLPIPIPSRRASCSRSGSASWA